VRHRPVLVTACFLFLGTWLLLSATSAGHFFVADEMTYFYMAQSFVDHGTFDVPSGETDLNVRQSQRGKDGKYYSPYSFGHSLYLVPWVWVADGVQGLLHTPWSPVFTFSFAHSLTTSLTWTVFFLILLSYGLPVRKALIFALASLASTLAFPYARTLFAEPVLALGLTVAWLCFRNRGKHSFGFALLGALALAFAVTVRPSAAVLLPGLWLLAWQQAGSHQAGVEVPPSRRRRYKRLVLVMSISLIGLILFGFYNYSRFGRFLATGYPPLSTGQPQGFTTPLWFGFAVFLASPGKAVWLFNPLVVLAAAGWRRLWSTDAAAAIFVAWIFTSNLVVHSLWTQPEAGVCWGPRFFVGVLPVLLLPAAFFWHRSNSTKVRYGMAALVLIGLLVQVVGTSVNYSGVLVFESMVPRFASKAVYYTSPDTYNLAFSPFPSHIGKLSEILSQGNLLAVRPEAVRAASDRSATHSFPFWCDTLDVWAVQLTKDGYPAGRVLTIEIWLVFSGVVCLFLAFRKANTATARNEKQDEILGDHATLVLPD